MPTPFPGLDFGTTNSTLGLCVPGGTPTLLPVEGESLTIPSALFFSLEDGHTYLGRAAIAEYVDGAEGRFMRALKSILGTSLMRETTLVGRERMSFTDLIGRFLKNLREKLPEDADAVTLGRPVHFVDDDAAADRTAQDQLEAAARSQGFRHIEFQFEPVAAALYYEQQVDAEQLALVVDIGGGTSDFSVVRLSPERARRPDRLGDILASTGVHVGGTDFDRALTIARVMPELGMGTRTADGKRIMPNWYFNDVATWHRVNLLYTPKVRREVEELRKEAAEPQKLMRYEHVLAHRSGHRLAGASEAAKIALTDIEDTVIGLEEPGLSMRVPVTRAEFDAAAADLVGRIDAAVGEALVAAGVDAGEVETVILTGGGAQVPAVRAAATRRFGHARIAQSDAFGSVGLGLAIDASRRFG
ncbi:Hsp70 family protein [Mangrovibrevibacter kandeliae]|uniref:Hsp70 family protein n=1 Tax=Mangrovibrevibacter kandeliae TaxID=2968473 RepID=UPI002119207A|nr:Hsp70 family protein [Aurantimonas sp. CSK15Z-1]MCQ8783398.1 Hsp70 family protein [Aurantimonas sp. CSK15Z-1]